MYSTSVAGSSSMDANNNIIEQQLEAVNIHCVCGNILILYSLFIRITDMYAETIGKQVK